jgi:hypothetical protein
MPDRDSYRSDLADEIEKQIEEAAEMGEPPSFALRRDQADALLHYLRSSGPLQQPKHIQRWSYEHDRHVRDDTGEWVCYEDVAALFATRSGS